MAGLLLERGANLLAMDARGRVPRKLADQYGHSTTAEFLRRAAQSGLVKREEEEEAAEENGSRDPREPQLQSWRRMQGFTK
jgi:hypothetical protein